MSVSGRLWKSLGSLYLRRKAIAPSVQAFRSCSSNGDFKSQLALENLYPQSSLNPAKLVEPPKSVDKFSGYIPMDQLNFEYSRSSGPGGQNVNKSNSKVTIRFSIEKANWIPEAVKNNIWNKLRTKITKEGELLISSDRTRSQHLNVADALEKLRELIRSCEPEIVAEPTPETKEMLRKRREKSIRIRLQEKRQKSFTKQSRGSAGVQL